MCRVIRGAKRKDCTTRSEGTKGLGSDAIAAGYAGAGGPGHVDPPWRKVEINSRCGAIVQNARLVRYRQHLGCGHVPIQI
jgi:hypothetical protein